MSSMKTNEKSVLEKIFQMDGGGVLNFTYKTMSEFFLDNLGINIQDEQYNYRSGSKANLMRGFWNQANDQLVSKSIIELLDYIDNEILLGNLKENDFPGKLIQKSKEIALGLSSKNNHVISQDEQNFLQEEFSDTEIKIQDLDKANFEIIHQRISEIDKCLQHEIPLGAIFLVGSTLEGILFDLSQKNATEFCGTNSAPKNKGVVIPLDEWSLSSLIDVSYELGYLGLNTKKFSHGLKDFRNFIHPREQAKYNFNPDKYSAKICFQVLKSAIDDIQKKIKKI
jgi:hypothetical protein